MKKWLLLIFFVNVLFAQIKIEPHERYNLKKVGHKTYELVLSDIKQTLVRLTGEVESDEHERVVWSTEKKFKWSNDITSDEFKVVNPYTYSNNGVVNTMFGPLPEMKGKTIKITAKYKEFKDTIFIKLK
jgi:hypothetical protein